MYTRKYLHLWHLDATLSKYEVDDEIHGSKVDANLVSGQIYSVVNW